MNYKTESEQKKNIYLITLIIIEALCLISILIATGKHATVVEQYAMLLPDVIGICAAVGMLAGIWKKRIGGPVS